VPFELTETYKILLKIKYLVEDNVRGILTDARLQLLAGQYGPQIGATSKNDQSYDWQYWLYTKIKIPTIAKLTGVTEI